MGKNNDIAERRPYNQFLEYVQGRVQESDDYQVADELATEQVERIATAESLDEIFDAMRLQGLTGLRDLENGTEFEIRGFRLIRSTRDDISGRAGVYAIIDTIDLFDGKEMPVDTSIERVLVFLIKCEQLNMFPVQVRLLKKTTQSGNDMITFAPLAKRAEKAKA